MDVCNSASLFVITKGVSSGVSSNSFATVGNVTSGAVILGALAADVV